jgi:hypothetical protein
MQTEPQVEGPSIRDGPTLIEANRPGTVRSFVAVSPLVWSLSFTGRTSTSYVCRDVQTGSLSVSTHGRWQ